MNIAIQKGLEDLKNELEKRGHTVFWVGENIIADAVLYEELDTYPYYEVNNIPATVTSSIEGNVGYGALLVNVRNKSIEDIISILNRRTYSPLF